MMTLKFNSWPDRRLGYPSEFCTSRKEAAETTEALAYQEEQEHLVRDRAISMRASSSSSHRV